MRTGTKILIGAVAVAAVGGIGWYLWSRGKQVAEGGGDAVVGPSSLDLGTGSYGRRAPTYAPSTPKGLRLTGLALV